MSTETLDFRSQMDSSGFHRGLREMSSATTKFASGVTSTLSGINFASLLGIGAVGAIGSGLTSIARAGDETAGSFARIRAAIGDGGEASSALGRLEELAGKTGVAASEAAGQFTRFAIAAKQIGASNSDVLKLVELVQKAGVVGGASTAELGAAGTQLAQALASGKLQGDELRSIMENMPNLAVALADGLGVSVGKLREMGAAGELTAEKVFPALLRGADDINAKFAMMPVTMGRAFDSMINEAKGGLATLDNQFSASKFASFVFQSVAADLRSAFGGRSVAVPEKETLIPGLTTGLGSFTNKASEADEKAAEQFNKDMQKIHEERIKNEQRFMGVMDDMRSEIAEGIERREKEDQRMGESMRHVFDQIAAAADTARDKIGQMIDNTGDKLSAAIADRDQKRAANIQFGLLSNDERREQVRAENDFKREQRRQERIEKRGGVDARFGAERNGRGAKAVLLAEETIKRLEQIMDKLVAAQGAL